MKHPTPIFQLSGLSLFAAATIFLATNTAHAGAAISGKVTLDVQYVCHDGGNRGYNPRIYLTKYGGQAFTTYGAPPDTQWTSNPKYYHDATECFDMATEFKRGDIVYVWYRRDSNAHKCPNFRLKYVPNRTDIWVQNRGSHAADVTCVAKWSLKGHINSPVVRPPATVHQASEICHDGANRGAQPRLLFSDGKRRWAPDGMTYKGYHTPTQCFKLPHLKNGTVLTVYHQARYLNDELYAGKQPGHIGWCDEFKVKINRNAKRIWVQNGGRSVSDIRCRARRSL